MTSRGWTFEILLASRSEQVGELGVMPIPAGVEAGTARYDRTGGTRSALGGWHLSVNPHAPRRKLDAAYHVLDATTTEAFQLSMLESDGWLPPRPSLYESARATSVEPIGQYLPTLRLAVEAAVPRPVTTVWPREATRIADRVSAALRGTLTPTDAMAALAADLKATEQG